MAKDGRFWFDHDYGARNDDKILELRAEFGAEGYGVFWMLIETMADSENASIQLSRIGGLAHGFGVSKAKLQKIITHSISIDLLVEEHGFLSSRRIRNHKNYRHEISQKNKDNADKRWGKKNAVAYQSYTNGMQDVCEHDAHDMTRHNINIKKDIPDSDFGGKKPPIPPIATILPKKEDFNGLPDRIVSDLTKLLLVVKKVEVEKEEILTIWDVFKNQNLTGSNPYKNEEDVYRHFINWGAKQSFRKKPKPRQSKIAANKDPVVGVEFINDFTQCRMSDNSVVILSRNQSDNAKFGQIKPSSIKPE